MRKMYSPRQIAIGTFFGGPLAAIYFLKGNFDTLGKDELSKKTMLIGSVVAIFLIAIMPFVPESTPNSVIPILYLIPVIMLVKSHQLTKVEISESTEFSFQSSWKVFGMSLVWMFVFLIVAVAFMFALDVTGVVNFD